MNIFYLHESPVVSAKAMTNKHVVKMILESAQLLSTAHLVIDGVSVDGKSKTGRKNLQFVHPKSEILYKATHRNHPSAVWARETSKNYEWLYEHFLALCSEYTKRYGREHLSYTKLKDHLDLPPKNIRISGITKMPQAMPVVYHDICSVQAYRKYYEAEKLHITVDIERYNTILKGNNNG